MKNRCKAALNTLGQKIQSEVGEKLSCNVEKFFILGKIGTKVKTLHDLVSLKLEESENREGGSFLKH